MSTDAGKRDLVVTRVFDVPVERVWQAWLDPALVRQWWGPDGFTCPLAEIDFREGGTSLVCMSAPAFGDQYSAWHYTAIRPLQHIEYTHNLVDRAGRVIDPASVGLPPDFPQDVRNRVAFRDLGGGRTELTVTEFDWPPGQVLELSRMGLEQCLAKMAACLA